MELADHSGNKYEQVKHRTKLADALHHSGHSERSLAAFHEAEAMQAEWQPEYPLLWAVLGFRYCDLLLDEVESMICDSSRKLGQTDKLIAKCRDARNRATKSREWADHVYTDDILNTALDHLTLGRTYLLEYQVLKIAGREPEDDVLTRAETHLNQSVSLLRQAGQQQELPRGLLARASLWRVCGERKRGRQGEAEAEYFERAERDLGDVEQIAGRSGMLLFQIEAALERCRLALTLDDHLAISLSV